MDLHFTPRSFFTGIPFSLLAVLWGLGFLTAGQQSKSPAQLQDELQQWPHEKLVGAYGTAGSTHRDERGSLTKEMVLTEMVRRSDAACEQFLRQELETWRVTLKKNTEELARKRETRKSEDFTQEDFEDSSRLDRLRQNLELVTALRRVQKKPDPLALEVTWSPTARCDTRELPCFQVTVKNVDAGRESVSFTRGGDYRSGRHARWQFEVRDAQGRMLPQRDCPGYEGGGYYAKDVLAPGQSWDLMLPMQDYVDIKEPGEYTVRILYHNEVTIADWTHLGGLLVFTSAPFKLRVVKAAPQIIQLEPGARDRARKNIAALSEKQRVRVVLGTYHEGYHGFIDPKAPEGQLLTMRWQAVPELLATLREEKLSPHKRGWVFALLFAITQERDLNPFDSLLSRPLNGDPMPSFEWRADGEGSSTKFSGTPSETDQKALTAKWSQFAKEYLEIREAKP